MVLKRQFRDREEETPNRESKQRLTFTNVGRDFLRGFPTHEILPKLEPFLRNLVRDEVERSVIQFHRQSSRSSLDQIGPSQARAWQLRFVDKVPGTIFTGNRVVSERGKPMKVVICDSVLNNIVVSGPLSSIKLEILVLDGDFGCDDEQNWSENEFKANIVREREGKKPLVIGELRVVLRDGVGYVGDVIFTDNSSWTRSRTFRLGARVVQGTCEGMRVREARTEAFVVKDHRGESYKKHHPPSMEDEVWRLEKIGKDGAFRKRLAEKGITTVQELLRLYYADPSLLRNILGVISNKTWDTIIEHATECVVDENVYAYCKEAGISLVFNSVCKVIGVIFDGQTYQPLDKLNDLQMGLVKNLKRQAYKNVNAWVPLGDLSAFGPVIPSSSLLANPHGSPSSGLEQVNYASMLQDQLEMQSIPSYTTQPSYVGNFRDCGFMGASFSADPLGDASQIGHLITRDNFEFSGSQWQVNDFFSGPCNGALGTLSPNFGRFSRRGTPKARWRMIKAALTWGIFVRRKAAARRMAKPFSPMLLY